MNSYYKLLLAPLRPLGLLYGTLMQLRAFFYSSGTFRRYGADAGVISVGNLTMGGSGKTPLVIYLARLLRERGFSPAIISRGYGGAAKEKINLVSDGQTIYLDSQEAGDEPRLIAETLPGTPVLTGKKRRFPCDHAVSEYSSDLLILDDGFQHMQMRRDFDLVLFNAASLSENMHVFPGGLLREPFSALHRADCFVITGWTPGYQASVDTFKKFLQSRWPATPIFVSTYLPQCFVDNEGRRHSLHSLTGPVIAFCGIAGPQRFRKTLESIAISPAAFATFKDHADYSNDEIDSLTKLAKRHSASALVTTEKDLVKLRNVRFPVPLLALVMDVTLDEEFETLLLSRLGKKSSSSRAK